MVALNSQYDIARSRELVPTTWDGLCPFCLSAVARGTIHRCANGAEVQWIHGYPPVKLPSPTRTRLERQIAKLEAIETRAGAESWETVGDMHDVLACLRDLAEDL